jgi:hypothetical protein
MFGNRKRKPVVEAAVDKAPAAAPVGVTDGDEALLDPAWVAEQENAEAAAARLSDLGVGDDEFAQAVWLIQVDEAWHDQHHGSASTRVSRILSHGTASGLSPGQLAALQRLLARIDAARDVLGAAERRRASGRLSVAPGGRNF